MGKETNHEISIHGSLKYGKGIDVLGREREVGWEIHSTEHKENCKISKENCWHALFSERKSKKKDK